MENKSQEIVSLLKTKNRCLDRLMESTRSFLHAPLESLVVDRGGSDTPLAIYESERATIIQTLEFHDRRINTLIGEMAAADKTPSFMEEVKEELLQNEKLIIAVFNADDIVFARIREAQAQITKLITENRKSKDILSKFKSGQSATGDGMDKTL